MLPYRQEATVVHNAAELGTIRLSTWPLSEPRETPGGEAWDWTGEAEIEAAPLLIGKPNRRLHVVALGDDLAREFTVLAATRHDFLPHIDLRLREMTAG